MIARAVFDTLLGRDQHTRCVTQTFKVGATHASAAPDTFLRGQPTGYASTRLRVSNTCEAGPTLLSGARYTPQVLRRDQHTPQACLSRLRVSNTLAWCAQHTRDRCSTHPAGPHVHHPDAGHGPGEGCRVFLPSGLVQLLVLPQL